MTSDRDFELYKLLVEEVREVRRARRDLVNVFTTLNLAGVGALGFLLGGERSLHPALLFWLASALILICVIWRMSNAYYTRQLARKYEILYEREKALGFDCLEREWRGLPRKGPIRWFALEKAMPLLFVGGYVVFLAYQTTLSEFVALIDAIWRPFNALVESFV